MIHVDQQGPISTALNQGDRTNPMIIETRHRRNVMGRYFEDECNRLGLINKQPKPTTNWGSTPKTAEEIELIRYANSSPNRLNPDRAIFAARHLFPQDGDHSLQSSLNYYHEQLTNNPIIIYNVNEIDLDFLRQHFGGRLPHSFITPVLLAYYADYFFEEGNARARTESASKVVFNEKNIFQASEYEAKRVISHELQHVINRQEIEGQPVEDTYLFLFHSSVKPLYDRMQQFYLKYKNENYPFKKAVQAPMWENKGDPNNYFSADELLALLRGYEVYNLQVADMKKAGISEDVIKSQLDPQPYEFIETFTTENLQLLDSKYRHQLAQEVLSSQPDVKSRLEADKNSSEQIKIEPEDLL